jgi:hypothetical protein
MARMRWMSDSIGRTMAVCLRCDREIPVDPERIFYCYCRSHGTSDHVVAHDLAPAGSRRAA